MDEPECRDAFGSGLRQIHDVAGTGVSTCYHQRFRRPIAPFSHTDNLVNPSDGDSDSETVRGLGSLAARSLSVSMVGCAPLGLSLVSISPPLIHTGPPPRGHPKVPPRERCRASTPTSRSKLHRSKCLPRAWLDYLLYLETSSFSRISTAASESLPSRTPSGQRGRIRRLGR